MDILAGLCGLVIGAVAAWRPGVRPFDMTGRPMRGWILVASDGLTDDDLERWIGRALSYVEKLPPK
jgi:hypothetical protein